MAKDGTKSKILNTAYDLFRQQGFARVSVDTIAERAGVTKRTVYYHFQSKDDIVANVILNQHAYLLGQFQEWAGSSHGSPFQIVTNLFSRLYEWADRDTYLGSGFTRIATELADRPGHPARKAASAHKALVEQWLAGRLADAGGADPESCARSIMMLIEGSMILALIHGDATYIQDAGKTAGALVNGQE